MSRAPRLLTLLGCLMLAACPRAEADPLAGFGGGFDPLRHDAGTLPPATLSRPLRLAVPPFYADELAAGAVVTLERYLEDACGFDVELSASAAYDQEVTDKLVRGELDVAELSPFQYADARRGKAAIVPLAATVARGSASYGSYLVARVGSPLHTLDDLRGGRRVRLGLVAPL